MKINLEIIRIEEASSKVVALFLSKRCSMQENMRRYEKNEEEEFLVQTSPSNEREQGSSDNERKYMVFSKTSQFYSIAALSY
jgi:hypothetical protein